MTAVARTPQPSSPRDSSTRSDAVHAPQLSTYPTVAHKCACPRPGAHAGAAVHCWYTRYPQDIGDGRWSECLCACHEEDA